MKSAPTLFLALLLTCTAFARFNEGILSVNVAGDARVEVLIDSRRYSGEEHSVVLRDIEPGYHMVKVYSQRSRRKNTSAFNKNYQLLYSSRVYIKPRHHLDITINRFGKAMVDERSFGFFGRRDNDSYDETEDYYGKGNDDDRWNESFERGMDKEAFFTLHETLRREPFESSRLSLAKQAIARNYIRTERVRQLLKLFSFEDNKLELAKYAYRYTSDKRNYLILYESFRFSKSKEELEEYVRTHD